MNVDNLGTLIWAFVIVIAVISSITRSVRRAQVSIRATGSPQASAAPVPVFVPPPVEPVPARRRALPSVAPAAAVSAPVQVEPSEPLRAVRLFRGERALVRGIVALEVLGPPRCVREWTPIV